MHEAMQLMFLEQTKVVELLQSDKDDLEGELKRIRIYLSGVRSEYETVMGELTEKHDAELRRAQDSINDLKQRLYESDTLEVSRWFGAI